MDGGEPLPSSAAAAAVTVPTVASGANNPGSMDKKRGSTASQNAVLNRRVARSMTPMPLASPATSGPPDIARHVTWFQFTKDTN